MRHFAIMSMGRTGSTLLVDLLGSHPQIECRGELINPMMGMFKDHPGLPLREFLDGHAYQTTRPIRGFKMPVNWILYYPGILEEFRRDAYRIVRLRRDDALEHFLSVKLAKRNANWGSDRSYDVERVTIPPWEWLNFVGMRHALEDAMDRFCAGLETLRVTYEEILQETTHAAILEFLGADRRTLTTTTVRGRTRPTPEVVENYDALVRFFAASPYAPLFPPRGTPDTPRTTSRATTLPSGGATGGRSFVARCQTRSVLWAMRVRIFMSRQRTRFTFRKL
jgi:hypothetical protein